MRPSPVIVGIILLLVDVVVCCWWYCCCTDILVDKGNIFDKTVNLSNNTAFSKSPGIAISENCNDVYVA
ncbi:MAG: hypothetical protein WA941_12235 [Nitrososphaeraceae archaeon]